MTKKYKVCQSCSMPLSKDEGADYEGKMYCSRCYVDGKFTKPDITVTEMQELVAQKLVEMKFPKFVAKLMVRNIPKLERWKQQNKG